MARTKDVYNLVVFSSEKRKLALQQNALNSEKEACASVHVHNVSLWHFYYCLMQILSQIIFKVLK